MHEQGQPIACALAAILASRASYRAGATHPPNLRSNHSRTVTGQGKDQQQRPTWGITRISLLAYADSLPFLRLEQHSRFFRVSIPPADSCILCRNKRISNISIFLNLLDINNKIIRFAQNTEIDKIEHATSVRVSTSSYWYLEGRHDVEEEANDAGGGLEARETVFT